VSIDTPWNCEQNYYIDSKIKITKKLLEDERVIIHFPFNYNSIYRKDTFLFHKIFSSIINNKKITIGNVDINRELLHASFVCREIEKKQKHSIIGAGQLINIKKFIFDFYKINNLDYNNLVIEEGEQRGKTNEFYSSEYIPYTIEERLKEYKDDIQNSIG
jgi:GDP-D-mannose dehydratase